MAHHCQLILNQARSLVQTQLTRIAQLDQLVELKTYQSSGRKVELITLLKQRKQHHLHSKETTATRNQLVEAIDILDDEIEHLSEEKIRLANSLYCSVAVACEEVEEVMASCSGQHPGEAGKQSHEETNWQLSNLIAECRIQEN